MTQCSNTVGAAAYGAFWRIFFTKFLFRLTEPTSSWTLWSLFLGIIIDSTQGTDICTVKNCIITKKNTRSSNIFSITHSWFINVFITFVNRLLWSNRFSKSKCHILLKKHLCIESHSFRKSENQEKKKGKRNQHKSTLPKLLWSCPRFYLLNTLAPGALAGAGLLSAVSDPDLAPLNTDGATLPIRSEHRQRSNPIRQRLPMYS